MLVALAIGLGSMDMPIPQVASWEWVNWKFPKGVHAGETVFARWTLTQKRPPLHGAKTGIAVWRVDVHTTDGAMCAEGEIGAAIVRRTSAVHAEKTAEAPGQPRRRRRGRRGTGQREAAPAAEIAAPPTAATPATPAAERPSRRRRRKRGNGGEPAAAASSANQPEPAPEPAPARGVDGPALSPAPATPATSAVPAGGALTRVMRRLRRT